MKVGTDAILLGAWASAVSPKSVLDIGTGSGVIALMLAQRFPQSFVQAVEIDPAAAAQAAENAHASPWPDRVRVWNGCITELSGPDAFGPNAFDLPGGFDLVVSNPPWFGDGMATSSAARDQARHTSSMDYSQLISAVARLTRIGGFFCAVIPYSARHRFLPLADQHKLNCQRCCLVRPTANSQIKRMLLQFERSESTSDSNLLRQLSSVANSKAAATAAGSSDAANARTQHDIPVPLIEELVVEPTRRHHYSARFQELTREFYLRFRS